MQLHFIQMNKRIKKYLKARNREKAKEQGFFDGRFRSRIVPDKKKKAAREACRRKNRNIDTDV